MAISEILNLHLKDLMKVIGMKHVVEVMGNEPGTLLIERHSGGFEEMPAPWFTSDWAMTLCRGLANELQLPFDGDRDPRLDVQLPGGHRVHWIIGPNIESGLSMTVRVKRPFKASFADFGLDETSAEAVQLQQAMIDGKAIMVSGGTSTGKTTLLDFLVGFIPSHRRVIITEDVPELTRRHRNFVRLLVSRMVANTNMKPADAIDSLVRMRPDVAGVGEISVGNASAYLRIANTGHDASFCTIHARTPWGAMRAIEQNVKMAGEDASGVIDAVAEVVDLIVQVKASDAGGGRRIRAITDVVVPRELPEYRDYKSAGRR